jgi:predicted nucleic acid-binding protein
VLAVTLDSEALAAVADRANPRHRRVMRYLEAARRLDRPVMVPTVILAELYRGPGHNALLDACLSRDAEALSLRDTDRRLARLVGAVLSAAGKGSVHLADAHVVATSLEHGGGVIVTGDEDDMTQLAGAYGWVTIDPL